jgi:hypothetical protein
MLDSASYGNGGRDGESRWRRLRRSRADLSLRGWAVTRTTTDGHGGRGTGVRLPVQAVDVLCTARPYGTARLSGFLTFSNGAVGNGGEATVWARKLGAKKPYEITLFGNGRDSPEPPGSRFDSRWCYKSLYSIRVFRCAGPRFLTAAKTRPSAEGVQCARDLRVPVYSLCYKATQSRIRTRFVSALDLMIAATHDG